MRIENDEMISPAQYAGKLDFCLGLEIDPSKLAGLQLIDSSSFRQWMPKSDRFGEKVRMCLETPGSFIGGSPIINPPIFIPFF